MAVSNTSASPLRRPGIIQQHQEHPALQAAGAPAICIRGPNQLSIRLLTYGATLTGGRAARAVAFSLVSHPRSLAMKPSTCDVMLCDKAGANLVVGDAAPVLRAGSSMISPRFAASGSSAGLGLLAAWFRRFASPIADRSHHRSAHHSRLCAATGAKFML